MIPYIYKSRQIKINDGRKKSLAVLFGFLSYIIARDYGNQSTTFRRIKRKFSKKHHYSTKQRDIKMATYADQAFFQNKGAAGICSAFERELKENGKLSERGNKQIDSFVREINARLADKAGKE
jgi:hypothetical protein